MRRWLDEPSAIDPDMVETVLAVGGGGRPTGRSSSGCGPRCSARATASSGSVSSARSAPCAMPPWPRTPSRSRWTSASTLASPWGCCGGSPIIARRAVLAVDFLKSHYDALAARLPKGTFSPAAYFPWVAAGLCASDTRQEMEAFFRPRAATIEGAPRVLEQALESVDQCRARRRRTAAERRRVPAGAPGRQPLTRPRTRGLRHDHRCALDRLQQDVRKPTGRSCATCWSCPASTSATAG